MDIRSAIDSAIALAKAGAAVFPGLANGVDLAEKTLDILDGLKNSAPDNETSGDLEEAHQELYDEMIAKGHALSARLRG